MPRNTLVLLILAFLAGCSTTVSTQMSPTQPTPSSSLSGAEGSPQPGPSPSPGTPDSTPTPANPLPSSPANTSGSAQGQRLQVSPDRIFLTFMGDKKRLAVVFSDANGQALPIDPNQLQWRSDHPQDIAVDNQGEVTALTDFATTTIRVSDTRSGLSATAAVDVTSSGTGSFSGPRPAPTPIPAPAITSFGPTFGPAGTTVTVNGSNFTGATAVTVNGLNITSFTVVNDAVLLVTMPAGGTSGPVAMTTPAGNFTSPNNFNFAPTLTGVAPATGIAGTVVTLTGSNLTGSTAVTINGINATSFTVVNDTTVTATIPAGNTNGNIVLTTPAGSATAPTAFAISPPTLTGINLTQGATGTVLTLTGTHFTGATAVQFGGTAASSFTVNSPTQITATVPASLALGAVQATVTTSGGTTAGQTFTVTSRVVYVNGSVVGGNNDGTSWAHAFGSLTAALTASAAGQEVWIAAGTYKPAGPGGDRNATFQLKDNVSVYGGFNGTQTLLSQRDRLAHPVLLSGDLNGNDNATITTAEPTRSDNSLRVVNGANSLTLDGVTITSGNASTGGGGAGISLNNHTGITFNNVHFLNHSGLAGTSLYSNTSSFTLNNGVFHNNTTQSESGAAIRMLAGNGIMNNVIFSNNAAIGTNVGAIGVQNSGNLTVNNGTFFNNTAGTQGGGAAISDSAILTLRNCILWSSPIRLNTNNVALNLIFTTLQGDVAGGINNLGGGTINNDGNTLATDPLFVNTGDLDGPDDLFGNANDGLQLQAGSPSANTGTATGAPATDITGLARPVGGTYDRGAYERTP